MDKARYSMSLFVWYFGTDRKYDDVAHRTSCSGLATRGCSTTSSTASTSRRTSASTCTGRPPPIEPGTRGLRRLLRAVPRAHLDSGVDWREQAEPPQKVMNYLSKTVMPGLEDHITASHMLTPIGFRDELSSVKGAASAWSRCSSERLLPASQRSRGHRSSVPCGRGHAPGSRVPGVLSSAKVLERVIPDARAHAPTMSQPPESPAPLLHDEDVRLCRASLANGSKSFSAASWFAAVGEGSAAVFCAFCRLADDLVDDGGDPDGAVVELRERLDEIFAGTPKNRPSTARSPSSSASTTSLAPYLTPSSTASSGTRRGTATRQSRTSSATPRASHPR